MSYADDIFIKNCQYILAEGEMQEGKVRAHWADGTPAYAKKVFGLVNRYDLSREFPILTLRKMAYRNAIDELLWIWQKRSSKVSDLRSHIWDQWAFPDGTIGKAYGYQLGKKVQYPDGSFDQVERVLKDIQENPESRRLICNMYNIEELPEMALYPCAYSVTFHVDKGRLSALLMQRSQDMLVANGWNVLQYAVLVHIFARHCRLEVGELLHVIADAHIYDRHIPMIEEMLQGKTYPAPKLVIDPAAIRLEDYRPESFSFEDYQHGPALKNIPVAI